MMESVLHVTIEWGDRDPSDRVATISDFAADLPEGSAITIEAEPPVETVATLRPAAAAAPKQET